MRDMRAWAAFREVPIKWPNPHFPFKSMIALRAACGAGTLEATERIYAAGWAEGKNVADPAVLAEALGPDGAELVKR